MPTWMWLLLIGGGAYVMLKKPAVDTAGMSPEYAAQQAAEAAGVAAAATVPGAMPGLYGVGRVRV